MALNSFELKCQVTRGTSGLASFLIIGVASYTMPPCSINSSSPPPHFPLLHLESFVRPRVATPSSKLLVTCCLSTFEGTVASILRPFLQVSSLLFIFIIFFISIFLAHRLLCFETCQNRFLENSRRL